MARRFLTAGPEKHGRSETRVPQIACGTPNLGRRTAKTRPIWSPGRPDRVRHADSLAPDRKSTADLKPGSPGLRAARRFYRGAQGRGAPAPRRRRDGDDFHLQNQAQVSISEVFFPGSCSRGFPSPPPGASGPPLSRVFTLRGARTGVPHANWVTWLSDVP